MRIEYVTGMKSRKKQIIELKEELDRKTNECWVLQRLVADLKEDARRNTRIYSKGEIISNYWLIDFNDEDRLRMETTMVRGLVHDIADKMYSMGAMTHYVIPDLSNKSTKHIVAVTVRLPKPEKEEDQT